MILINEIFNEFDWSIMVITNKLFIRHFKINEIKSHYHSTIKIFTIHSIIDEISLRWLEDTNDLPSFSNHSRYLVWKFYEKLWEYWRCFQTKACNGRRRVRERDRRTYHQLFNWKCLYYLHSFYFVPFLHLKLFHCAFLLCFTLRRHRPTATTESKS